MTKPITFDLGLVAIIVFVWSNQKKLALYLNQNAPPPLILEIQENFEQNGAELGHAQVSCTLKLKACLTAAVTVLKLCLLDPVDQIKFKNVVGQYWLIELSWGD